MASPSQHREPSGPADTGNQHTHARTLYCRQPTHAPWRRHLHTCLIVVPIRICGVSSSTSKTKQLIFSLLLRCGSTTGFSLSVRSLPWMPVKGCHLLAFCLFASNLPPSCSCWRRVVRIIRKTRGSDAVRYIFKANLFPLVYDARCPQYEPGIRHTGINEVHAQFRLEAPCC
jgi:hypothetical protein